jgi:hypothetical protein
MGSESEDKYNDREPHKRERSSAGAGIRGCERAERNRGTERELGIRIRGRGEGSGIDIVEREGKRQGEGEGEGDGGEGREGKGWVCGDVGARAWTEERTRDKRRYAGDGKERLTN